MIRAVAHTFSLLGHPALLMPLVVLVAAGARGLAPILATGAIAAIVFGYSAMRVRAGHWRDSDASAPHERVELNAFLAVLLLSAAALAHWLGQPLQLVVGLALSSAIVLAALVLRRVLKLSLHVAFAVFGAGVLLPLAPALGFALAVFAAGTAWSRLYLQRHTRADIAAGAVAGAVAALAFTFV